MKRQRGGHRGASEGSWWEWGREGEGRRAIIVAVSVLKVNL